MPTEAGARLARTTATFEALRRDTAAARSRQGELFADMAAVVEKSPEVAVAQKAARDSGSYAAGSSADLFEAARAMLTPEVLERIRTADPAVFRFPGMFGAVAPLFPLLGA